jgi:hypothetical protein
MRLEKQWFASSVVVAAFHAMACVGDEPAAISGANDGGAETGAADGGSSPETGASNGGDAAAGKRVFVTSALFAGDFGGVTQADAKCQQAAGAAGLGGTFKAWLSVDGEDTWPSKRFTKTSGYVRIDGMAVATSWNDLTDGNLQAPINVDENGRPVTTDPFVWTNTDEGGAQGNLAQDCSDWTSTSTTAIVGNATKLDTSWTDDDDASLKDCGQQLRLYCFEQ